MTRQYEVERGCASRPLDLHSVCIRQWVARNRPHRVGGLRRSAEVYLSGCG